MIVSLLVSLFRLQSADFAWNFRYPRTRTDILWPSNLDPVHPSTLNIHTHVLINKRGEISTRNSKRGTWCTETSVAPYCKLLTKGVRSHYANAMTGSNDQVILLKGLSDVSPYILDGINV